MGGPVGFDELDHGTAVTRERPGQVGDLSHPAGSHDAAPTQGFFGQVAQKAAPGRPPATCLDVYGPKQVIRERHHHLGHGLAVYPVLPGATRVT